MFGFVPPCISPAFSVCGHRILCMRQFHAIDYVTRSDFVFAVIENARDFFPHSLSFNNDDPQFSGNTQHHYASPSVYIYRLIETITQICGRHFPPHEYVHIKKATSLTHSPWCMLAIT